MSNITLASKAALKKLFREQVAETFPDFGVIGEELGTSNPAAGFQWIIGPINGSSELANGMQFYGLFAYGT